MAQKAAKTIAVRNAALLKQTHLTTLGLHALFLTMTLLLHRPHSLLLYALLTSPTLIINFYLERLGRPRHSPSGALLSPGEDLYASGAMDYIWDVLYWTWGCMIMVVVLGDALWWLWVVVPLYTVYAVYQAFVGVRNSLPGVGGGVGMETEGESARGASRGRRGEQKVRYRG